MSTAKALPATRLLAAVPLFKALTPTTLGLLAAASQRRPLKRGEWLFQQGEQSTGMYVVVYGEIKLIATTPARGQRLTDVAGPGDSFGEPMMFLERPMVVGAQAANDALVLYLPSEVLFAEIERDPHLARRMLAGLSRRVASLVQALEQQTMANASERVAGYLLRHAGANGESVTLTAKKAEIATQLGLTAEHFSRVLRELSAAGLLCTRGRQIALLDRAALARLALQA
ncbi:Crp/Fnr family transcriptional regulator [Ottowia sp.]|uniref:Crp/Fnr family transcriptional regulator n=1 Tax=Ottowia sp. TaxID=1898956 RepID=UPI002C85D2D8|nr:Crp/Fnr family transcriptional regulator [Ottowia sp.]HRN74797.1 Crp/Fnr family transcriptional regulator [Ottowia sp.]HRQ01949.1 Crp/Fnr family transcriptional regulator [Ottowia sp.]